jgi:hypothetical protein
LCGSEIDPDSSATIILSNVVFPAPLRPAKPNGGRAGQGGRRLIEKDSRPQLATAMMAVAAAAMVATLF